MFKFKETQYAKNILLGKTCDKCIHVSSDWEETHCQQHGERKNPDICKYYWVWGDHEDG